MELAFKYAQAFLNLYSDTLTFDDIKKIDQAAQFLQEHRRALFLLQVPVVKQAIKEENLKAFCRRFDLSKPIEKVIKLLLDHKRVYLLTAVLNGIVYWYQKRHNIEKVVIKSSVPLPETYRHSIVQFVERSISGVKQYYYKVDPTLIAGIRIQSDTMLWEFSIDKRLREIARAHIW